MINKLKMILAAAACAAAAGAAFADGANSSVNFVASGVETPGGDIRSVIDPKLRGLPIPEAVKNAPIDPGDLLTIPTLYSAKTIGDPIVIGVEERLGRSQHATWLKFTTVQIQHMFGDLVKIVYLDQTAMSLAIESGLVDFYIVGAETFALEQSYRTEPLTALASFVPREADSGEHAQAGVVFYKKGAFNQSNPDLDAIAASSIAAVDSKSLAGWLSIRSFFGRRGVDIPAVPSNAAFYGENFNLLIEDVLAGTRTTGFLPSCVLEAHQAVDPDIFDKIDVLTPKPASTLSCVHTTREYPSWVFGTTARTDPGWKRTLSSLLYSLNEEKYGGQWQIPAVNRAVLDMFYVLKMGPYEALSTWSMERFFKENGEYIVVLILIAFFVVVYVGTLTIMVRRKNLELKEALEERALSEMKAQQSRQHIANLETTGIVGQMSTIIAHELKQPLSAIMNFANGLNRRVRKENFDKESFEWALGEIVGEAQRASEIVNRVRSYAKHDFPPRSIEDLSTVIESAISTFRRSRQTGAEIEVEIAKGSLAEIDSWEIELLVLNLLKNAADATISIRQPRLAVRLKKAEEGRTWLLSVSDNGPPITDEQLDNLFKPLNTSKGSAGLGLGLSICSSIAERHAGRITAARNTDSSGITFTVSIPMAPEGSTLPPKKSFVAEGMPFYEAHKNNKNL